MGPADDFVYFWPDGPDGDVKVRMTPEQAEAWKAGAFSAAFWTSAPSEMIAQDDGRIVSVYDVTSQRILGAETVEEAEEITDEAAGDA